MANWISLSHTLNLSTPAYGNGEGLQLEQTRDMCLGHTSNNSKISMPLHHGTHIDFPKHFSETGKTSSDYHPQNFIFQSIGYSELKEMNDLVIRPNNFELSKCYENCELLIIKTGFVDKRHLNEYWENGFGFAPETASYLRNKFPHLRAIGFDLISLNSYQHREMGREAHKEFLIKNDILIIEDMDLSQLNKETIIQEVIVAPFWIDNVDGLPVTILAKCQ
jgi:kynurenine formamidase